MEELSFRWFSIYYLALGLFLVTGGVYLLAQRRLVTSWLQTVNKTEHPPAMWVQLTKYLLLFTIPSLVLSFFPFSWPELLFSLWSFIIVYTVGQLLLHWGETTAAIRRSSDQLSGKMGFIAANMISIGLVLFLLWYHLLAGRTGT